METKYVFSLVTFIVSLISYGISSMPQYEEVSGNFLFVFFMLLVYATLGTILGGMFLKDKDSKPKKSKKEVKFNEL